jgi:putative transposase
MARPLRIEFENALYHITARGFEKKTIFQNVSDRKKFLYYLKENLERYNVILYAYVLMDNHYHLLIETLLPNLNRFMHDLNTSYSVYYNRHINRVGPLFQGRYKSFLVDKESYLLELSRYIHLNPMRSGYVATAEKYPWSSYQTYLGLNKVEWINWQWIRDRFGNHPFVKYRRFVIDGLRGSHPFKNLIAGSILGSKSFVDDVKEKLSKRDWQTEVPSLKKLKSYTLDEIIEKIAEYFQVDKREILKRRRNYIPRKVALYLARKYTSEGIERIGKKFDISYTTVSKAMARIVTEMNKRKEIEHAIEEIKRGL